MHALHRSDRGQLKALGVVFGAFTLYLPALYRTETRAFGEIFARLAAPGWRPASDGVTVLSAPPPPPEALALRALRSVGGYAAPVLTLERLDLAMRAAEVEKRDLALDEALAATLGWSVAETEALARALGFFRSRKSGPEGPSLWRRRAERPEEAAPGPSKKKRRRRRKRESAPA